jgi:hypothetical protein
MAAILGCCSRFRPSRWTVWPVSTRVNTPKNDDPDLLSRFRGECRCAAGREWRVTDGPSCPCTSFAAMQT